MPRERDKLAQSQLRETTEQQFKQALFKCFNLYFSEITKDNVCLKQPKEISTDYNESQDFFADISRFEGSFFEQHLKLDQKLIAKGFALLTAVKICYELQEAGSEASDSSLLKAAKYIQGKKNVLDKKRSGTFQAAVETILKLADKLLGVCSGVGIARRLSGERTVGFFASKIQTQGHDAVSAADVVLFQPQIGA